MDLCSFQTGKRLTVRRCRDGPCPLRSHNGCNFLGGLPIGNLPFEIRGGRSVHRPYEKFSTFGLSGQSPVSYERDIGRVAVVSE